MCRECASDLGFCMKRCPRCYANLPKQVPGDQTVTRQPDASQTLAVLVAPYCSDRIQSGALAERSFFEVVSYVWPKPTFFPKFQRPADRSDHPSSATEEHLRDKRKAHNSYRHHRVQKEWAIVEACLKEDSSKLKPTITTTENVILAYFSIF